jgi:hypothetical protein
MNFDAGIETSPSLYMKYSFKAILHTSQKQSEQTEVPTLLFSLKYSAGKEH